MSDRLITDWRGLKKLGWPYSRAHTWRMMFDPDYADSRFPHVASWASIGMLTRCGAWRMSSPTSRPTV